MNAKNLSVYEYTSPCPKTIDVNASLNEVEEIMNDLGVRHVPVLEKNEVVGVISQRDVNFVKSLSVRDKINAYSIMTKNPYIVSQDEEMSEVAYQMSNRKIGSALVTDAAGELVGIFTSTDALNALVEITRGEILS